MSLAQFVARFVWILLASIQSIAKEASVNFLTDPLEERSTLRPADILVFGWTGGKHACVDLTVVSFLVGLSDNRFVTGHAALGESRISFAIQNGVAAACCPFIGQFIAIVFLAKDLKY
ncbi:hypothetical protein L1987_39580 [Smallanthus sonchifolius]|uniref:Uncharacterized protein n=1 Tax=Smallanthus sonchifolius TaxID=185202 RepID=A0ACB9HNK2_9ASTR|nr:hypothetical protein L1987_39580 [Smallanthus sonchifolius]